MVMSKEYRIPLPLTVDEYRIAQLYMLAKKSREESHGEGSGIEILVNEPYEGGPGPEGRGQYTRKVYHVGSHLPAWVKSLIPKSALSVEEEAWNAYPYTKTRFTCPFVERFSIEVETSYHNDGGHRDNVFSLSAAELKQREVDLIDIVRDQLYGADFVEAEDPTQFCSQKTGRGPLGENWIRDYWAECQGRETPLPDGKAIMCAYKMCKVEFRYWGVQTKIEKFIHDSALRKTMLRAHRQAWAWLDEWWGLTIEDIRAIEKETQEILARKYAASEDDTPAPQQGHERTPSPPETLQPSSQAASNDRTNPPRDKLEPGNGVPSGDDVSERSSSNSPRDWSANPDFLRGEDLAARCSSWSRSASRNTLSSHSQASWRMESIRRDSASSDTDDEFFDCQGSSVPTIHEDLLESTPALHKWSSLELLPNNETTPAGRSDDLQNKENIFASAVYPQWGSVPPDMLASPSLSPAHQSSPCDTTVLLLVAHGGSVLDTGAEAPPAKKSDVTTFRGVFESVARQHYPRLGGRVALRLVPTPSVCASARAVLSSLAPHVGTESGGGEECAPVAALPILGTVTREYEDAVNRTAEALNAAFTAFVESDEGAGFCGQVCIIGDSVGGLLCFDALCRGPPTSDNQSPGGDELDATTKLRRSGSPHEPRGVGLASQEAFPGVPHVEFDVSALFLFGCPLALVLVYRRILARDNQDQPRAAPRPACHQVFNLFHPTDPLAVRLEPLLSARFSFLPPVTIPRYAKFPLGDGYPTYLLECIQSHVSVFHPAAHRRASDSSLASVTSGAADSVPLATITALSERWWGRKRLDYALYCPEGLATFPATVLPHLFHASYWESPDVAAFVIRQLVGYGPSGGTGGDEKGGAPPRLQPREKWQRKRTSVKIKNIASNHRGNDVIVATGAPQHIQARFMYGPLDMVTLSGEKVDVYVRRDPPAGDWELLGTALTEKGGRLTHVVPQENHLPGGVFPIKMIVRGDHTTCNLHMAVVPPRTEMVVFSIDGSFTASVSVTGRDPKVRPGAVDVVRHWQELGYMILYVTGRPDMQQTRVVSWLAQHNFPHGLVSFADGLSTDPLGHKADYLRTIIQEAEVVIGAAYGSAKDIGVYSSLGILPDRIFIVGKASKKQSTHAQVLADGYAAHLTHLQTEGNLRPARVNSQISLPKGFFGLPGQNNAVRRRSTKRTSSYPVLGSLPNEGILETRGAFSQSQRPANHTAAKS